jgi:hypothetical protein
MSIIPAMDPSGTSSTGPVRTSLTERAVDRLARRTEGRNPRPGLTRRSFLVRAAVIGSALSVAPMRWMLRPTSAYASVCGTGASCGQGWTAFCCTISQGANTCPPGSYVAGWWKIDRSPFCRDAPRYIVDCNRSPGSSCSCRCASGSCDQRRVCCNNFRYGQCNTQVPGVTEVVCRVVICTPPWTWDPACGRTVRTDNRTVTHNAPCLPGTNPTPIELRYQDLGLTGSVLGRPSAAETAGPRSGAWRRYERGVIAHRGTTGTRVLLGAVGTEYTRTGGPGGSLGYPTTDHQALGGSLGERVRFERGDIYLSGSTAVTLLGPTATRYRELGGPGGDLGRPATGTVPVGDGLGSVTLFVQGAIYASGRIGTQQLTKIYADRYAALGGPVGSGLGYPLRSTETSRQHFEHGTLVRVGDRVHALRGSIALRYEALGGSSGPWGALRGDQDRVGTVDRAVFADATVYAGPGTAPNALTEPVLAAYLAAGGPTGSLGAPTGDSFRTRSGHHRGSFRNGALEIDPATKTVRRLDRRAPRSPSELTP